MSRPMVHDVSLVDVYYPSKEQALLEQALLQEGAISEFMGDIFQTALSSGAVAAFPGAGADTIVDAMFAIKDSKGIFDAVEKMLGGDELGQVILGAAKLNFAGDRKKFYNEVKSLAAKALAVTGAQGRKAVKKAVKKIDAALKRVKDLIAKVARSVGKWVSMVLPNDLGLGGPAFRAFVSKTVDAAAGNAYDLTVRGLDSLKATKYLLDPPIAGDLFLDLTDQTLEFVNKAINEEEANLGGPLEDVDVSWLDVMAGGMAASARMQGKFSYVVYRALVDEPADVKLAKNMYRKNLPKVKAWLIDFRDKVVPYVVSAIKKLISWLFAGLAAFQMLSNKKERARLLKNYDKPKKSDQEKLAAAYDPSVSKRALRAIIHEERAAQNARQAVHRVIMSESKSIIKRLARREVLTECMKDLITEKMIVATVNDITAFKPEIRDWAEVLVGELEQRAERMKDMSDKRRESIINSLVSVAVKDLIKTTGGMTSPSAAKFKREEEEKKYQQMKRNRRLGY